MLSDDEQFEALEASSPPLDDARERIGLKKRVAVCVDNRESYAPRRWREG